MSDRAKILVRATEGSIGYDLYSAMYKSIALQSCEAVATNITLISPRGIYPRVVTRSSLAIKMTLGPVLSIWIIEVTLKL